MTRTILLISLLLPLAVCARTPMASTAAADLTAYTAPRSTPEKYTAVFTPGGQLVEKSDDGIFLLALDPASGNITDTLINLRHTRENTIASFEDFILSPDASKILLKTESQPVFRRSETAKYYVYERRTRLLRPLSTAHPLQRDPLFSPDSRMVAFVADGDIFCAKLDYQTEVAVTTDGAASGGNILNGGADWTYEEEFGMTAAMAWAPDNLNLAYLKWDQTQVPVYPLPLYEGTCEAIEQYRLYPGRLDVHYPVAGQPNAQVSLHCYDVETRKTVETALPGSPCYIPFIGYAPQGDRLIAAALNRDQNIFEIFCINPKSTVCRSIYTDESRAWIIPEAYEQLTLEENSLVVATDRSGYTQYCRISYTGGDMGTIGMANADATEYYGTDGAGNTYFQAAAPTPMDRTVYRTDRRGQTAPVGTEGGTSDAVFSPDKSLACLVYSDLHTAPATTLVRTAGWRTLRTLEDNAEYTAATASKCAHREFISVPSGEYTLNGYVVRPANMAPGRRYPVIMSQYSGPGSQSVLNRWTFGWEDYYASQGYVVVCVDGRGTGGRGAAFRTAVYRRLGELETADQLAAARFAATLPYADGSNIGIYGWSYGGYETLMAASAPDTPYAAACAVAPVTDWRFYDTVYTERYMLTPQQNESGYNASSALRRARNLGCPLLTVYGTADDNVHPANTLQYVSALQFEGILSEMYVFPNMNHSINGCNARAMVYARMLQFFDAHLK